MTSRSILIVVAGLVVIAGLAPACGGEPTYPGLGPQSISPTPKTLVPVARVTDVFITGVAQAYTFAVTVDSPDTGCDSYVDWWEVVTPEGALVYRHTLLHSHADEQPFTRAGGPVAIAEDDEVIVRAHMNTTGYAANALRLRATGRQTPVTLTHEFAAALEFLEPQAPECAF